MRKVYNKAIKQAFYICCLISPFASFSQITTPNYPSKTTGGRIDSSKIREANEANPSEQAAIYVQFILQYRLKVHAAHHVAQNPIYLKQEKATVPELENYAAVAKHVVKLQDFIFWNGDSIFSLRITGNQNNDAINRQKYNFLVKVLGDYKINTEGPFKRVDINDTIQFLNNLREFLSLPLFLSHPFPRHLDSEMLNQIPSGVIKQPAQPSTTTRIQIEPVAVASKDNSDAKPARTTTSNQSITDEASRSEGILNDELDKIIPNLKVRDAAQVSKLLELLGNTKSTDIKRLSEIESILQSQARSKDYKSTIDYAKFLLIKSKIKGNDRETAVAAGAYLILADEIGEKKENYGPFLFLSYFRDQPEDIKAAAREYFSKSLK